MSPASEPNAAGLCACTTLRKASRAISRLYEDRFLQTGMTITQYSVLRSLHRQADQPLSRLAEEMVMDRTSLYRLIAPLERQGWLAVGAGPGRARIASMTPAGREAMERAKPVWETTQDEFLTRFGGEAWAGLAAVLSQVVAVAGTEARP